MVTNCELSFREESKRRLSIIKSLLSIMGRKIAATPETGIATRQKILDKTFSYSYYTQSIEKDLWIEAIQYPCLRELLKRINENNDILHDLYALLLQHLKHVKDELTS